jgi:hypothetical protein
MMSRDHRDEIAALLPSMAAERLPEGRKQLLREHVMTEIRSAQAAADDVPATRQNRNQDRHRSRLRSRTLVAVMASAAMAGAGAATLVLTRGGNTGASPAAVLLLDKIAVHASHQPTPAVTDSQFWYIKSWVAYSACDGNTGKCTLEKPHERQIWQSVSDACQGLLREDGQDTSLAPTAIGNGPQPTCPQRGAVNDPTYRFLQSLPTDPHALLTLIYQQMQGQQPQPEEAFTTIGDMLHEAIAPPEVSAALYRAAALIPGVTVVPDATNALGHHGVAVAFEAQGVRMEWIFDKQTFQYIGEDDINVADGSTNGESAIMQQAFVNHEGQVPHP